jgi:hypothetical protein
MNVALLDQGHALGGEALQVDRADLGTVFVGAANDRA